MSSTSPRSPSRQAAKDEQPSGKKVASDAAHTLFVESTTVLWMIYRTTLSRPARWLVPDHTREAFFQAFCDLRTNTPKDRKWLKRHLTALKPHTSKGWLALGAALMVTGSALASLLCVVGALLTLLLYSTLFVSVLAGLALGTLLSVLSVTMLVAATMAGISAACIGGGYTTLEVASRSLGWANRHILRPASRQLPVLDDNAGTNQRQDTLLLKRRSDMQMTQQQQQHIPLSPPSDSQLSSDSSFQVFSQADSDHKAPSQFAEAKDRFLQQVKGHSPTAQASDSSFVATPGANHADGSSNLLAVSSMKAV